ncbi:MAG TPA: sensor histidine kinase, partial [Acidobacteriota bacterium]|nr:sensor histidine kinase [Acidobacteriota bacterium]
KERKRTEEKLSQSLKEKEVLLREIHHRVKNNMQIISSLLNLQASQIDDKKTSGIFRICQNRIRSMALIHQKLYQSEDFSRIDFSSYIRNLTESLHLIYEGEVGDIDFQMNLDKVYLNINQAIPLGLIVNELVSNALKYAFPRKVPRNDASGKKIRITLEFGTDRSDTVNFMICDNGVGLPPDFDLKKAESLGLRLVQDLAKQLKGAIEIKGSPGAFFKISFPYEK